MHSIQDSTSKLENSRYMSKGIYIANTFHSDEASKEEVVQTSLTKRLIDTTAGIPIGKTVNRIDVNDLEMR